MKLPYIEVTLVMRFPEAELAKEGKTVEDVKRKFGEMRTLAANDAQRAQR